MMFRLLVALLLAVSFAWGKTPITHEAMWLMKRVGPPTPSPDGRWVVFPVTEPAYDEKDQASELWIVPADGSVKPRRLTSTKAAESGVAWAPDNRRIAFTTRREGDDVNQVYVLDVTGGEAVRVTSQSAAASSPRWRPDGRALLFTAAAYAGAPDEEANRKIATERKARKYTARVYDAFPIRYWDRWLEETRPHLWVQALDADGRADGKPRDLLAGTRLATEPGFAGSPTLSGEELSAAWAPDAATIVFVATTKRNTAAYASVNTQLWSMAAAGGEPKALTNGEDSYSRPSFSPDSTFK